MATALVHAAGQSPAAVRAADAAPAPGRGAARALASCARHLGVVALFALPAVVLWWHAWSGHLTSTLTCVCGDPAQTVWFVAWPAYAVSHGLDPFFSVMVQAPYGVNLLDNAAGVPLGLALAPVTWAAGPVAATTVALTLSPALTAWAAWIAARRVSGWGPGAVLAGALYGYSPFVVSNLSQGHLSLAFLPVPPLLVVAGREVLAGPPARRRRWAVAGGLLLGIQFLLSAEVFVLVVLAGVVAVAAWAAVGRGVPVPWRQLLGVGAVVAGALVAFPAWFALTGPQHLRGPVWPGAPVQGAPLVSLVDPGHFAARAGTLLQLSGYEGRAGPPAAYMGPVLLVVALATAVACWRRRLVRVLIVVAAVTTVMSWGALLQIAPGHPVGVWLPWRVLGSWPVLSDLIPERASLVTDLCLALLAAVGLERVRRAAFRTARVRRGLVAGIGLLAVASLWATYQVPFATQRVSVPRWFEAAAPRLPASTTVLTFPFPFPASGTAAPMAWDAVAGFPVRLAGAYAKVPDDKGRPLSDHPGREPLGTLAALSAADVGPLPRLDPPTVAAVRRAVAHWRVGVVVVTASGRDPARAVAVVQAALGRPAARVDGSWVWRVRAPRRS